MALSSESLPYLTDAMGSTVAGNALINAIQNHTQLSALATIRLNSAFGDVQRAANFQACILGTYALNIQDAQFVKSAFSAPVSVLTSIFANLAGGVAKGVNPSSI